MSEVAFKLKYPVEHPVDGWLKLLGVRKNPSLTAAPTAVRTQQPVPEVMQVRLVDAQTAAATAQSETELAMSALAARIRSFELPRNWDDEDAPAISRQACEAAISLVEDAWQQRPDLGPPRAAPSTVRGAVALTWRVPGANLTIFVRRGSLRKLAYQWEGAGYRHEVGEEAYAGIMNRLRQI